MKTGRFVFLVLFLALLGYVAVTQAQGPGLSPVQFLPGDEANQAAAFDQQEPFIARGADSYLVVWTETRTDAGRKQGSYFDGSGSDIYAARLDAAGNLLDTTPFIVTQAPADQKAPRAAWNGQNWLVVWVSQEPTEFFWSWDVMAARVSPQGVVLDPQPVKVSSLSGSSSTGFTVSSDGANWAIIWQGSSAGEAEVRGARIAPNGALLDPVGKVILPETYYVRSDFDIAFAMDEYLLTWQGLSAVEGKRLKPDLTAVDATTLTLSPSAGSLYDSRVGSNGTDFLVIWEETVSTTYYQAIKGVRVSHAGQILDPTPIVVWDDYGGYTGRDPAVSWDGSNWFVSFMLNGITVLRISPAGTLLDPNNIPADFSNTSNKWSPESSPAFGGGIRLVWRDTRYGGPWPGDVRTAAVSATRVFGPEAEVSFGLPTQARVSAAANGSGYMLAFRSDVSQAQRIKAQRLDVYGNALIVEPVLVASGLSLGAPAIAWNGSLYLVVWSDGSQIYGRRLHNDGSFPDPAPFVIMPGHSPDVAALDGNFLVVGAHAPSNPHFQFPFGVRVRGSDGAVLGSPIQLGQYFARVPRVAALGSRWLVVWQRNVTHDNPTSEIKGNFVAANGAPSGEFSIRTDFYDVRFHYRPAMAASADTALVVWEDPRVSNSDWNIYGRRIQADGTLLDSNTGIPIVTAPNDQGQAALAWDGNQFIVIYEDKRAVTYFMDTRTDIFASRVAQSGALLDPNGFAVLNGAVPEIFPDVAGGNGQALLTASAYRDIAPFMAYRLAMRTLNAGPMPPTPTATNTAGSPTPTATNTVNPPTPVVTVTSTRPPRATKTPAVTATATSAPPTATATPGSAGSMHIVDLDGAGVDNVQSWTAVVTVLVQDSGGNPVSGATVTGNWSSGASGAGSCTTGSSGQCEIGKSNLRRPSVTFTVTSVAHGALSYDAGANADPDGDSNGTTIIIMKP